MVRIYIVDLTEEERTFLLKFIKSGKHSARKINRARILLLADEGKTDREIAAAFRLSPQANALHTTVPTVQRTRQRFVQGNLEYALNERPRPGGPKKLDGRAEAVLIALAHSAPSAGRKSWTMQLLADRLVDLKVVDSISDETVRRALKKNLSNLG